MTDADRPEIAVPEEAAGRGPLLRGELRSKGCRLPDVLVQFEQLEPLTRKSRIHLLLTAEQAKKLYALGADALEFEGSFCTREGVIETRIARDIWLKPISQITHKEAFYWTQTSGDIGSLETREMFLPGPELDSRRDSSSAWFIARRCFALAIVANHTREEAKRAAEYGFSKTDVHLSLSGGARASIHRYRRNPNPSDEKRSGISIVVEGYCDPVTVKKDIDALILLASFASRERSVCEHWSFEAKGEFVRFWQFNFGKFRKRYDREEPVIRGDRNTFHAFLQTAFDKYSVCAHRSLLEGAIHALFSNQMTIEVEISRLFSAIQGALYFATQLPLTSKRPRVSELYRDFLFKHPTASDGLWPLFDRSGGPPLYHLRNAIVHGEAFSEEDWKSLSYAGEHLRWHLERIILLSLEWDVQQSTVSMNALRLFFSFHDWQREISQIASRRSRQKA